VPRVRGGGFAGQQTALVLCGTRPSRNAEFFRGSFAENLNPENCERGVEAQRVAREAEGGVREAWVGERGDTMGAEGAGGGTHHARLASSQEHHKPHDRPQFIRLRAACRQRRHGGRHLSRVGRR
jgi:hypothetical protein